MSLNKFIEAQREIYGTVKTELLSGKKKTHWMWYIFPQVMGLGTSENAIHYAIQSQDEALEYFNHPVLGKRLIELTKIILRLDDTAENIFGHIDTLKFHSSMTLFDEAQKSTSVFSQALDRFFDGKKDEATLKQISL